MLEMRFFDHCAQLMERIRKTEMDGMRKAAEMIAQAVSRSRSFVIHDRGHLIGGELLGRAGGPVFVRRLDVAVPEALLLHPDTGLRQASRERLTGEARAQRRRTFEREYIDYLFDVNGLSEGDVLLLNSNSGYGYTASVVAETAKRKGMGLIVISSRATAEAVTPEGEGKKLCEYADVLLDNHAPFGDAVFEAEGMDEKVWPASGLGAAFLAWPIVLMAMERLAAMGVRPSVYRSINIPGGAEQYKAVVQRYESEGY